MTGDLLLLAVDDPLAVTVTGAIRTGDLTTLRRLLTAHPGLATARLVDRTGEAPGATSRTLLHVVTDWPGRFPHGAVTVATLVAAGGDVDARFAGPHRETPLHWAASCDDVDVVDALLDAGADIEAAGGVIAGGTPLADARAFAQWRAAYRLVVRGARTTLTDAATLGLLDRVERACTGVVPPSADEIDAAFWGACHGGRQSCAGYLWERGARLNWIPPWEHRTALDAAVRRGATELVVWLRARGGVTAAERDRQPPGPTP
ncbi:ankyrin repeat domain-containing protein [Micromonospora matsumotoense]|uniref:ankyrin repeat domain-containing protein n=1 Tax=Micromonospora matsumotoense TaxID=121616 RepID=UPI003D8E1EE5